jgi:GNAT superfamily N-acetyltransferase
MVEVSPDLTAQFVIRSATPKDVSTVFFLINALAAYERLSHAVDGNETLLEQHLFGKQPFAQVILAECDGKAVGFALFFPNYSTLSMRPGLYLEDLFVLPDYRGLGLGKALLIHLAELVHMQQGGQLTWSVLDWNEPAIAFYRRMGADIADGFRICRVTGDALAQMAAPTVEGIRPARSEDLPTLYALAKANAEVHNYSHRFNGNLDELEAALFGNAPCAEAIVAEAAGEIAGFALFFHNYSTFLTKPGLYIEDLFVVPSHRRNGVGRAMLTYVAQQAAARDCGRLEWLLVLDNEPAIAFYQRLGTHILPDWRVCQVAGEAIVHLANFPQPKSNLSALQENRLTHSD